MTTIVKEKEVVKHDGITGSEAVIRSLINEGAETIFGYPGGAIMPIYDALYDFDKELRHILTRHEQVQYMRLKHMQKSLIYRELFLQHQVPEPLT